MMIAPNVKESARFNEDFDFKLDLDGEVFTSSEHSAGGVLSRFVFLLGDFILSDVWPACHDCRPALDGLNGGEDVSDAVIPEKDALVFFFRMGFGDLCPSDFDSMALK